MVLGLCEELKASDGVDVRYAEASMRNGFGLRYLHRFLGLPYLALRKEALLRQLELNEREVKAMEQELDLYFESEECDYEKFSEGLTKRRRREAEKSAPKPTVDVVVGLGKKTTTPPATSKPTPPPAPATTSPPKTEERKKTPEREVTKSPIKNIDNFVPSSLEDSPTKSAAIDFFLEDHDEISKGEINTNKSANQQQFDTEDDDDDDDGVNPMVATVKDDLSDDDIITTPNNTNNDYEEL